MELEQLVTVATFDQWDDAEVARHQFDAAGIPAQSFDESLAQRLWWFAQPKASMRVRVEKKNTERALALMNEWASDPQNHVLDDAIRCPDCGGSSIEYPQMSRKTLQTIFFGLLNVLHLVPRMYFCETCHYTWPGEPEKPKPEVDSMNWPMRHPKGPAGA